MVQPSGGLQSADGQFTQSGGLIPDTEGLIIILFSIRFVSLQYRMYLLLDWHSNVYLTPSFCDFCSSSGKLLDVDDQYYPALSTSQSDPSMSTENTSSSSMPETRQSIERKQSMERRQSIEKRQSMDRRRSMGRRRSMDRRQSVDQRLPAPSRQPRERAATEPEPPRPGKERCVISVFFIVFLITKMCPVECPE